MEVTVEMVQKRLIQLQQEREQLLANLNAYNGAIEECKHWLDVLEDVEAWVNP